VIGRTWAVLRRDRRPIVVTALAAGVLSCVLALTGTNLPGRPLGVLIFLVLGPGLAVTGFARFDDLLDELVVVVPLSLAIDVLVGAAMSFARAWDTDLALLGLTTAAAAATAAQERLRRRRAPVRDPIR